MLRFVFVVLILGAGAVLSLGSSLYALLLYLWWAYFRPDHWVYTPLFLNLPFSLGIGLFLVVRAAFAGEIAIKTDIRALLLVAILGLSTISTVQSDYFSFAWPYLWDFTRSLIITYLIAVLATDTKRLRLIILVISLSLAFEGAKQGWAQLFLNPGATNVNDVAFLGDNNLVAVGMLMLVALLVSLARTAHYRAERWLYIFLIVGVLYRAISTYSRGGFLAALGLGLIYILRSPRKLRALAGAALAVLIVTSVLPDEYWDRMQTIDVNRPVVEGTEHDDDSALGRLHFWQVGLAMAEARPFLGVGINSYTQAYDAYDFSQGEFGSKRSVHSMWFGYLAEMGFAGTALFIMALLLAFLACWRARRYAKRGLVSKELGDFGAGLEAAIVTNMIGATFVIFQYNEMLWHVIGLSMAVHYLTMQELAQRATSRDAVEQRFRDESLPYGGQTHRPAHAG